MVAQSDEITMETTSQTSSSNTGSVITSPQKEATPTMTTGTTLAQTTPIGSSQSMSGIEMTSQQQQQQFDC